MSYTATSTATSPVSLTNHAYFNLSAGADDTVCRHTLQLACDAFAPDDGSGDGLPTGSFVAVHGTARDLRDSGISLAQIIDDQARLSPLWPHGEEFVVTANRGLDCNAVAAACQQQGALPPLAALSPSPLLPPSPPPLAARVACPLPLVLLLERWWWVREREDA